MFVKKSFGFIAGAIALLIIFFPGYSKIRELQEKNADLIQKNRRLKEENLLLKNELIRLDKDQVYQEKILREKMGVVRKDEIPVKLIPQQKEED